MSDVVSKWGKAVAERGFAQIPTYLLNLNRFLDKDHRLSPVEMLVLFQLVGSWWKKDESPFPSISTLAIRCGVSSRQVQRAVTKLNELKLIERINRKNKGIIASNAYSMEPLVKLLEEVAKAFPNDYPRRVSIEDRQKFSEKLGPLLKKKSSVSDGDDEEDEIE